jgi:hypothetical protein
MNVEAIKSAMEAIGSVFTVFKQAKDLLPSGPKKEALETAIAHAEQQIKIAEAQVAKELDYPLCPCVWPPSIMTGKRNPDRTIHFKCNACGYEYDATGGSYLRVIAK